MHRRHDPTYYWATRRLPRGDPARDARPLRLRAHGGRDRRRAAAAGERRGAPRRAGRLGARARTTAWRRAARRIPSSARWWTPAGATGCRSASCAPTCARCGSTARPCGSRPGRSSRPTWTARPGSVGRIMAPLLGVPARHHAGYGRLGQAFQLANFIRDVREDTHARTGSTCPRRTAPPSASARRTWPARAPRRSCARCWPWRRAAPASCSPRPSRRSPPRPASVRTGVRFAVGVYLRVLDRVERIEFDVLGRGTAVRPWQLPGAALGALRR